MIAEWRRKQIVGTHYIGFNWGGEINIDFNEISHKLLLITNNTQIIIL